MSGSGPNVWWMVFAAAVGGLIYWLVDMLLRGNQAARLSHLRNEVISAKSAAAQSEAEVKRLLAELEALRLDHRNQTASFGLLHASALEKDQRLADAERLIAQLRAQLAGMAASRSASEGGGGAALRDAPRAKLTAI